MKKIAAFLLLFLPAMVQASEAVKLDEVEIDLSDRDSLQRGAHYYATYCLSCHSAKHMRYARIANELGITEERAKEELLPEGRKFYDSMITAMNAQDAEKWFGVKPPDLSLITRSRGPDWLYSYLRGFYADPPRALGVNNIVFQDVAMPNVFWELQGEKNAIFKEVDGQKVLKRFETVRAGSMGDKEFDALVTDLVNFLVYVGEPARLERESMGKYVLLFILILTVIAYLLKKEYWKNLH
ncbi:MAG: cytochrome c1 [Pseudomonadota bacterium]